MKEITAGFRHQGLHWQIGRAKQESYTVSFYVSLEGWAVKIRVHHNAQRLINQNQKAAVVDVQHAAVPPRTICAAVEAVVNGAVRNLGIARPNATKFPWVSYTRRPLPVAAPAVRP